jgi:hypothetical protein
MTSAEGNQNKKRGLIGGGEVSWRSRIKEWAASPLNGFRSDPGHDPGSALPSRRRPRSTLGRMFQPLIVDMPSGERDELREESSI